VSLQRKRHLNRQPIEEAARLAIAEFVGGAGQVDAERHSQEWRSDDLLLSVRLREPIAGSVLSLFRRELWNRMHATIPRGGECEDWLVVVQFDGANLTTVSSSTKAEEFEDGYGES
jgi:hypothetical protein